MFDLNKEAVAILYTFPYDNQKSCDQKNGDMQKNQINKFNKFVFFSFLINSLHESWEQTCSEIWSRMSQS